MLVHRGKTAWYVRDLQAVLRNKERQEVMNDKLERWRAICEKVALTLSCELGALTWSYFYFKNFPSFMCRGWILSPILEPGKPLKRLLQGIMRY